MRLRGTLSLPVVVALLACAASAQPERTPSIMAVMHKQYTVSKAPFTRIKKELDSESPDWEKVRAATKSFVTLAEALGKNEPRRGDSASWKRFTERHLDDAKAMDEGAKAGDKESIRSAYQKLATSCKDCHDAHRFRRDDGR